jgi:hypothetical protein
VNASPEEKLKIVEDLKAMAENANSRAEKEFLRIVASSILSSSPIIDKYSTWLLAGCGAIASIMIANISAVIPFLGTFGVKLSLYLLTISAVIGLLQKARAIKVQSFSEIAERLYTGPEPLWAKHQQAFEQLWKIAAEQGIDFRIGPALNLERIRNEMAALTPPFSSKRSSWSTSIRGQGMNYMAGERRWVD